MSGGRKKKPEEHSNHERWLVSYADFITLLFAFFVVMYSVSSVNEGKYRVLSEALVAAFRAPQKSMEPIQVGNVRKTPLGVDFSVRDTPGVIQIFNRPVPTPKRQGDPPPPARRPAQKGTAGTGATGTESGEVAMRRMAEEIERAVQPLIEKDLIKVRRTKLWVEVEINTSILFGSGSARLESTAVPVLESLAQILSRFPNPIHVEGFTDAVPINTLAYPSNWELSAARAASVVNLFTRSGIEPTRMAAIGYGEFRPVADNSTEEGRARNRRVVLVIEAGADARGQVAGRRAGSDEASTARKRRRAATPRARRSQVITREYRNCPACRVAAFGASACAREAIRTAGQGAEGRPRHDRSVVSEPRAPDGLYGDRTADRAAVPGHKCEFQASTHRLAGGRLCIRPRLSAGTRLAAGAGIAPGDCAMSIWAIANQKGGVGKTTTAVTLAGLTALAGEDTLLVDLDPHGSLTAYFGHDPDLVESGVYSLFHSSAVTQVNLVQPTPFEHLHLIPASTALATLDRQLGAQHGMGLVLARALNRLAGCFPRVIIDCPPMLGVLMVNALAACERLVIPVQTEFLALRGLERMLHTLNMISRSLRRGLPYTIVPTLFDRRTRAAIDSLRALRDEYTPALWDAVIPVDTRFREASRAGHPLSHQQPDARGTLAYAALLQFLLDLERLNIPRIAL